MARHRIDELLRLMGSGFDGPLEQSLFSNLKTVRDEDWVALPERAHRSIREMTLHVGLFKYIYANHAFRGAGMAYDDPPARPPAARLESVGSAMEWLREAHDYLTTAIDELPDDAELEVKRKAHWGEMLPTHTLIEIVLQHDLYHAGEINRTRALLQDDDRWAGG